VAIVSTHGVGPLRSTLHRIRETTDREVEIVILAAQHCEDVVEYITRHYLRGDVSAIALEASEREMAHCGIDTAFQVSHGDILVRVQDDLLFSPGWLDAAATAIEGDRKIGMLGLIRDDEPRRRGRPPKARAPEDVDEVDLRAFAVGNEVLREHLAEMRGERCNEGCRFQDRLRRRGYRVAYLPGQVKSGGRQLRSPSGSELEADLAFHPGQREAMAHLRQSYQLGEQVLRACPSCDEEEFEVLAAQIDFCEPHAVPVGYTYTLRCGTCQRLAFEEDHQFRCPD
jgi:hypothetical protein